MNQNSDLSYLLNVLSLSVGDGQEGPDGGADNDARVPAFPKPSDACRHCGAESSYNLKFDAYFCEDCDSWLEEKCRDPICEYCARRPDKPSMAM